MLDKIFSGGASDLVKSVGGVIDGLHTSEEERLAALEGMYLDEDGKPIYKDEYTDDMSGKERRTESKQNKKEIKEEFKADKAKLKQLKREGKITGKQKRQATRAERKKKRSAKKSNRKSKRAARRARRKNK